MEIACNSRTLPGLRREFPRHLVQPKPVKPPENRRKDHRQRRAKPITLIERRGDRERQRVAARVPYPAVVAGDDAEAVVAGLEIRILRLAFIDYFLPIQVLALQLVAKMDLLRGGKGQGRITNGYVADQSR